MKLVYFGITFFVLISGCTSSDKKTETCGNGIVEGGEQCETGNNQPECGLVGNFVGGTLQCSADCTWDTSLCRTIRCGDGILDYPEECEGENFDGETCESMGHFVGGTLYCNPEICKIETTNCIQPECTATSIPASSESIVSQHDICDGTQDYDMSNGSCNEYASSGKEQIFIVNVPENSTGVTVELRPQSCPDRYFVMYFLDECFSQNCTSMSEPIACVPKSVAYVNEDRHAKQVYLLVDTLDEIDCSEGSQFGVYELTARIWYTK
ncbi:hypothetical protein KKF34_02100 [Myxococcota bacterium]|nr:hypothetical protein [Myxococcota bacterium]MBU1379811.1 hypothetical protein [Myxococcota bacterium]MBU1495653.1 hypothetical protein [Myxococcota bacterium]